ncbi:MAG: FKBP-type peptidyl-prolyl cis-trans isomerase [Candidatus Obscuribacterales bacterium]|nr:FKBP-type peptidyl-prolyl cis-trans isomerase [Candidatus Obscuribacterales bacterium]
MQQSIFRTVMSVAAVAVLACSIPPALAQWDSDPLAGQKVVKTPTGLQYYDIEAGKGPSPSVGSTVIVHYTGWLLNKKKFDSSVDRGEPFSFQLGRGMVIKGWDEGVASMKVGGKRRLVIPGNLAYGAAGAAGGAIPPNATLVFDVQLLKFQ